MASESPVALIYGFNGSTYIETSIRAGIAVPSGQPGFIALGSDGTNTRYLRMASDGTVRVDPTGTTTQPVSGTFWQATQPVSIAATVAVSGPLTDTQLRASAVPVSVASLPLPSGAATEATLATLLTTSAFQARIPANGQAVMSASVPVVIASNQSVLPINDNGGSLTVDTTQLPAALVSGRLDVNIGASTSIAVTGPLTDTQLRATAVPVSGTVTANQGGTWNITNISGTVSLPTGAATQTTLASILTNTPAVGQALMAASSPVVIASNQSAIPVTGTFWQATQPVSSTQLPAALVGARLDSNVGAINNVTPLMGNGVTGTGSLRVTIASDNTAFSTNSIQSGTWTVQPGNTANTTAWRVEGQKTTNSAVPGANNVGVLPAVANTSAPTVADGNQVALSTDLNGQLRVTSSTTGSEELTYTVVAQAIVPGNNKSLLAIYNPTASGYVLKLREYYIRNAATAAVTGVAGNFELHRFVMASAPASGTNLTTSIASHDSADATPASMRASTGDTISGEVAAPLDLIRMSTDEWGPGTADVESFQQAISNYLPARAKRDGLIKPFIVRAGEGLHLKFATNSTAGLIDVVFVFTKV